MDQRPLSSFLPVARGFTFVELVIVTALLGILAAASYPMLVASMRAYDNTLGDIVVGDRLLYATERIAREIREVKYTAGTGFGFTSLGSNSMAFTRSYVDGSGTQSADVTVTIGNTGSAVTLAYNTYAALGAQTLIDGLNGTGGLAFQYLDKDGVLLASPTVLTVHYVAISLTVTQAGKTYVRNTTVELKND